MDEFRQHQAYRFVQLSVAVGTIRKKLSGEFSMKLSMRTSQRGITFFGLLFNAALFAVIGVVGAQVAPTYIEYLAVGRAAESAKNGQTPIEARDLFDKAATINDIKSISGKEIEVFKEGDKVVVSYAYQREIHLAGPAYLTLKYSGRSK
jgi:hypothetical protein